MKRLPSAFPGKKWNFLAAILRRSWPVLMLKIKASHQPNDTAYFERYCCQNDAPSH